MMKIVRKRIISVFLILSLLSSLLTGCGDKENLAGSAIGSDKELLEKVDTQEKVESKEDPSKPSVEEIASEAQYTLSTNWEDYVGDTETFVYGLMMNELGYLYEVFPASVQLSDGLSVFGLGYTDYEECFTNEEETVAYFSAGFIPGIGELTIPEEDFDSGLMIENLDFQDEETNFILKYQSDVFSDHCVVYGNYVTYGVNPEGVLFYEESSYERGKCDESLGSLYSFDEARYVYDVDFGEYSYISGDSLGQQLDYAALEEEINKILDTQDENFATVDIETSVYFAQEAITNYLLSLQEESFLGYDVKSLVEVANTLDPMECYRITSEGLLTIDLEYATEEEVARWLVGSASVIVVATGLVGSIVFIECPALSATASAIAGTGIEAFMQVVVENQKASGMDWSKVAVAACSGAVSGYLGPYISATTAGMKEFMIDSFLDGMIGGIEQTVFAYMDGEKGLAAIKSFGFGFTLGFGLSAGFKAAGKALSKVAEKVMPAVTEATGKLMPKLSAKVSKLTKAAGDKLYAMKKVADNTFFHSEYLSKKFSLKQITRLSENSAAELKERSFKELKKNKNILDVEGNPISSDELESIFDTAMDGDIIGKFEIKGDVVYIKKQNGIAGIVYDNTKYLTVELPNGLQNTAKPTGVEKDKFRIKNFTEAAKEYKKVWSEHPELIPKEIKEKLGEKGIQGVEPETIVNIVRDSNNGWVMHENIDMKTITLVSREVHDNRLNGISHMGGFGLVGYLKSHMGKQFFDRLVSAAATNAVIAQ